MRSSFLSVSFLSNGAWTISRTFSTLQAARKWARWLSTHSYVEKVAIHRGGPGGELIAA
jgi:hypothetical protein